MLTNKKAQVLTYDFFIATIIFFIVLTIAMNYWYYSMLQMEEIMEKNRAANEVFSASEVWFKEGYPKYWGILDVMEIGMEIGMCNENKINQTKMDMLPQLGYTKVISLLNLGTHNLQYTLYNSSNDLVFQFPSDTDLSSAKNIYQIDRVGVLNEQAVRIRTMIWY